ncbi:MAG: hypothetical protein LBI02_08475 [Opitutaceae bacterium]|jgi:hypothetical protein|nr:hypothetical protein [Opitutaceae bacterium]
MSRKLFEGKQVRSVWTNCTQGMRELLVSTTPQPVTNCNGLTNTLEMNQQEALLNQPYDKIVRLKNHQIAMPLKGKLQSYDFIVRLKLTAAARHVLLPQ